MKVGLAAGGTALGAGMTLTGAKFGHVNPIGVGIAVGSGYALQHTLRHPPVTHTSPQRFKQHYARKQRI